MVGVPADALDEAGPVWTVGGAFLAGGHGEDGLEEGVGSVANGETISHCNSC